MKEFIHHSLDIDKCKKQLIKFERLLSSKLSLSERAEILPFFKENIHIAAFLGTYIPDIANPDRIANELDIFGDFACDLAVGDSNSKTYLLVEFEDASPESLFKTTGRATPEWASRLEHGFSQVLDWFWKLADMEKSDAYEHIFGARHVSAHGLLVVGREQDLSKREEDRLKWRQDHTIIHSKRVSIITFDKLLKDLKYRMSRYQDVADTEPVPVD